MIDSLIVKIAILSTLLGTIVVSFWLFPKKRKKIAVVLFSGFVALSMAEVLLRLFYPQINQHDQMFEYEPLLGWRFTPNKTGPIVYPGEARHYIRINSQGFRDDEPPREMQHAKRILVVGDSFVSNIAVEDQAVFTEVMQHQLPDTSVLNFGVNGYSTVQEYLLLQQKTDDVNPDVIILVVYIRNDLTENVGEQWVPYPRPTAAWNEDFTIELVPAPPPRLAHSHSPLYFYKQLHLNQLINNSLSMIPHPTPGGYAPSVKTPPELYLCRRDLSPDTQMLYRIMEQMLLKIQRLVAAKHKPLILVLAPSRVQVDGELMSSVLRRYGAKENDYSFSLPDDMLMSFAKEHGFQTIDLLPALRSEARKGKRLYNSHEQHWNAEGNRVVAAVLLEHLRRSPFS